MDWNAEWKGWILDEDPSKAGKLPSRRAGKPEHSGLTEQQQQENEARMEAANAHSLRCWHENSIKLGIDPNTGVKPTSVPAPPVATRMTEIRTEPRPEPDEQYKPDHKRRVRFAERFTREHGQPLPANCGV